MWEQQFNELKKNRKLHEGFKELYSLVYEHNGVIEISDDFDRTVGRNITPANLAYAHSDGLVEYVNGTRNIVQLTKKGKYFIKLYLERRF